MLNESMVEAVRSIATSKRGYTKWKDLIGGSKKGFRNNILIWSLPKVNNTYKKRIKTILNQYYA